MEIKIDGIYSFKLHSGQEIIGKIISIDEDGYQLDAPLTIGQGQNGMEFMPVMFTTALGDPAKMYFSGLAMTLPTREDVVEAYNESINPSSVLKPVTKQIITG
jgi:hypothetical protein